MISLFPISLSLNVRDTASLSLPREISLQGSLVLSFITCTSIVGGTGFYLLFQNGSIVLEEVKPRLIPDLPKSGLSATSIGPNQTVSLKMGPGILPCFWMAQNWQSDLNRTHFNYMRSTFKSLQGIRPKSRGQAVSWPASSPCLVCLLTPLPNQLLKMPQQEGHFGLTVILLPVHILCCLITLLNKCLIIN